jgi:hypothetical protein
MIGLVLSRIALVLGGGLFLFSFFMPMGFMHAPFGMMQWMAGAVLSSESAGEAAAFCGASFVITYPYVWALLVVFAGLRGFSWKRGAWPWLHVAVHTMGGLTLMALCVTLLLLNDSWLPAKLQWAGVVLSVIILLSVWFTALFVPRDRRVWVLIAVGMMLHLLFQVMLAVVSVGRAGQAIGFVVGSIGALLALGGSIGSACFRPRSVAGDATAVVSKQ